MGFDLIPTACSFYFNPNTIFKVPRSQLRVRLVHKILKMNIESTYHSQKLLTNIVM